MAYIRESSKTGPKIRRAGELSSIQGREIFVGDNCSLVIAQNISRSTTSEYNLQMGYNCQFCVFPVLFLVKFSQP